MRTILIIDDDPRFRSQAREVLESDGFVVVGEAGDGVSGVAAARSLRPEFALVDVGLPDVSGFQVALDLAADWPAPLVVLTSSRDARAFGRRLKDGPAIGFIPKERLSGSVIRDLAGSAAALDQGGPT